MTPINTTAGKCCHLERASSVFTELLKTKRTIRTFQQKQQLSLKKAMALNENLPIQFDKPQIKVESQH
jgi:hypothetical protein